MSKQKTLLSDLKIVKHIPNTISVFRMGAALGLLLTKPLSALFFAIYMFCGISDALDGYIARKTGHTSKLGAALDSLSDFIFIVVLVIILIPAIKWQWWHILWVLVIATIRFATLAVSVAKFKKPAFLHTYANKLTGLLLFLLVFAFVLPDISVMVIIILSVATLSAIEEFVIMVKSKTLNRDIKSIWDIENRAK